MKTIPTQQIVNHIQSENIWWKAPHQIPERFIKLKPRPYITPFLPLAKQTAVNRAVVLMGPRRVGKTVLLHHAIQDLIAGGANPKSICYFSVDRPIFNGLSLEQLIDLYSQANGYDIKKHSGFVIFDEIQYLRNWETHLKTLVDQFPNIRFIVSGSAAAALRLKSIESGAGRFTDFLLPPLTFHEYLTLLGKTDLITINESDESGTFAQTPSIDKLNHCFIDYLNYGGYPEVIFSEQIKAEPERFIKGDIIDKVLLRDLPSLYGIADIQELNSLFTTLAYNTAQEVSLDELSKNSGVAKNTIKRYIEYLEAAFLIKTIQRIDRNTRRFKRANYFKAYLTNPSMRSALFSPVSVDDSENLGHLTETAVFSQWFHDSSSKFYARWKSGEVDLVHLQAGKPLWAVEVKWSDRHFNKPGDLKNLISFCKTNQLKKALATTKTQTGQITVGDMTLQFIPASLYCCTVGYSLMKNKT